MDINDKELFDSALTDDAPDLEPVNPEEGAVVVEDGQPRDEHGRFAPKAQDEPEQQPQAEPAAQAQPGKDEAHVPSWRLREVREEAERRLNEERANWQRQYEMLQRQNQPKPEPAPQDVFENPDGFVDHRVDQRIDPIKAEVQETRNYYSFRDAVREHGKEKVSAAFDSLNQAAKGGDREAQDLCARVHRGLIDPWGEITSWHQKASVYQQIGNDPNAWFEKQLEERLSKDQAFAGSLMQKIQQSARGPVAQGQSKIALPPSLNRIPGAQVATDDDTDMSDAALYRHATR